MQPDARARMPLVDQRLFDDLPVPPVELREHAGRIPAGLRDRVESQPWFVPGDPEETYRRIGRQIADELFGALPDDWSFEGKRILDFGCGAGRVVRHLVPLAGHAQLWGCDIDRPSIEWLENNLSPPLNVFVNGEHPPLPHPDGSFDLILAASVFTHLVDSGSAWLAELHRVLEDDGLLVATFKNRGSFLGPEQVAWDEPWDEDQIGMHVYNAGRGWDKGGPAVFHSEWWLRAHWGRAFEFVELRPNTLGQGIAVMRRRAGRFSGEDIEALEVNEPREIAGLQYSLRHSRRETAALRQDLERSADQLRRRSEQLDMARRALERAREERRKDRGTSTPKQGVSVWRRLRPTVRRAVRRLLQKP